MCPVRSVTYVSGRSFFSPEFAVRGRSLQNGRCGPLFWSGCMRLSLHPVDEARARAAAWLTAWDSQGAHRTATAGDEAGAIWLANEAAGCGVEAGSEAFELDRLDPGACYPELDGGRISPGPGICAPAP